MNILNIKKKAFTLIELLIVITIIGILAVALVPRITGGPAKARDATRKIDANSIASLLEFYADDNGGIYPSSTGQCFSNIQGELTDYMKSNIADPKEGNKWNGCDGGYGYIALDPSGAGVASGYMIIVKLENTSGTGDGIYQESSLSTDSGISAAANMSASSACGDEVDCSDGTVYMIGG